MHASANTTPREESGTALSCTSCGLYGICFARRLGVDDGATSPVVDRADTAIAPGRPLPGTWSERLFVLRSGALKRCRYTRSGEEVIAGFHFPGETLGLEEPTAATEQYVVLEKAHLCHIRWSRVDELMGEDPAVRDAVSRMLREELAACRERLLRACRGSARQRVAALLLDLAARRRRRSLEADRIRLPMGRREIAAYLDVTIETVSRTLSQFRRSGVIELRGRQLRLLDEPALAEIAEWGEDARLCG
ncbi:Crp/Fnr family transcriptional regulator [Arhodomonas sp. SL1]|uniref:Crp/Fnr family transcriptional regulator n=1 Tax=Arhodomonas sp. SL1 TaxID=3425691 RepID=UPI003F88266F